jgi:hypothetical protein
MVINDMVLGENESKARFSRLGKSGANRGLGFAE